MMSQTGSAFNTDIKMGTGKDLSVSNCTALFMCFPKCGSDAIKLEVLRHRTSTLFCIRQHKESKMKIDIIGWAVVSV